MFKTIRIAILLYVLVFVALGQFLADRRSSDWDDPLWVGIYLVNGSGSIATADYIDRLPVDAFAGIERFFERESGAHGLKLEHPFRVRIHAALDRALPPIPENGNMLATIFWSLRMRWLSARLDFSDDGPTPDIKVFAVYHSAAPELALDRSTALRKGMIAVANLFAEEAMEGSNAMIVAHELLHTLGATDKYDPATNLPLYPDGYAEPDRSPLHPQRAAELMAGRIPLGNGHAKTPPSLRDVRIGQLTASEIGWGAVTR